MYAVRVAESRGLLATPHCSIFPAETIGTMRENTTRSVIRRLNFIELHRQIFGRTTHKFSVTFLYEKKRQKAPDFSRGMNAVF
jgi:hypothetical protein